MSRTWPMRIAVVTAALTILAGCAPVNSSLPGTSQSPSASESFGDIGKARSLFVEYIAANAKVDLANEDSWQPLLNVLTGDQLARESKALHEFRDAGWTKSGATKVAWLGETDLDPSDSVVVLEACLDSTGVTYSNADGEPMSSSDGDTIRSVTAIIEDSSDGKWLLADLRPRSDGYKCGG